MSYILEKDIWTHEDFDIMGWHDCRIYKIRIGQDLEMDIDYIFKWVEPEIKGMGYNFWIAPATLIFQNIQSLFFEIDTNFEESIEIQEIDMEVIEDELCWTINTHQGKFEFKSSGFHQYIRQKPTFQFGQTISYFERGGLSLERTTNQKNTNLLSKELLDSKNKDLEDYENAKKRLLVRIEKENLENARNNNEIGTKEYLIKKREIKNKLEFYDFMLKNSLF